MTPKIFISGKITGDPKYKAKFAAAENFYKKMGYIVLNPAVLPEGMPPADYMHICFAMIATADVVAFLPGFSKSPGARLEAEYCFYTNKNTIMPEGESLETPNCSEKELTALKAVYYLAERNPRLKHGGTWVEDIHNLETCQRISFWEAMHLVCNMLYAADNEGVTN
mgnify:CR=1 FL=1